MSNPIHVHVQAVRALTCKRSTAQAAHAETCTRTRTECTPTHAHSRAIGKPFMRPKPNIVHVQVQCTCSTPLTCNRWTAQTVHKRCATQTAHTEHCASTRCTQTSTRQVHHSVRHAERRTRNHTRTHDDRYTAWATHDDRRPCTHTRIHVQRCTAWVANAERRRVRTPA